MSQVERVTKEFEKSQALLLLRKVCDRKCFTAETDIVKDEKGKKITINIPCRKIVPVNQVSRCELYLDPKKQWEKGQCLFPGAALSIKDVEKLNARKHRRLG